MLYSTVPAVRKLFEILLLCIFVLMVCLNFSYSNSFSFFFVYEPGEEIGDDDAKAIAQVLRTNTTLAYLWLFGKYHTHTPSFSHDSRFDLASCVCTRMETSFLLQNDGLQQDDLSCVAFFLHS